MMTGSCAGLAVRCNGVVTLWPPLGSLQGAKALELARLEEPLHDREDHSGDGVASSRASAAAWVSHGQEGGRGEGGTGQWTQLGSVPTASWEQHRAVQYRVRRRGGAFLYSVRLPGDGWSVLFTSERLLPEEEVLLLAARQLSLGQS